MSETINTQPIDIAHLAAYAEDPRSYCHYKGVPRSIHNNKNLPKDYVQPKPLSSSLYKNLFYLILLCCICSGAWFYYVLNPPAIIAGKTIENSIALYIAIGLIFLAVILWKIRSYLLRRALFKLCGVTGSDFRLLESNLTGFKNSFTLKSHNFYGTPGALFLNNGKNAAYVCQYNPRDFKGRAKVRERYQMLLLIGMVMEKYKLKDVRGAIRYHDKLEFINFDPVIYKKLIALQNEYREAVKEWKAPNDRPLFNRDV